jgi:hypothetical protein
VQGWHQDGKREYPHRRQFDFPGQMLHLFRQLWEIKVSITRPDGSVVNIRTLSVAVTREGVGNLRIDIGSKLVCINVLRVNSVAFE